ncbi:VCBS repeat-containing protein, partial [bacterium]|nr:VCBS repeat-containing protein [bacterium]
MKVDKLFLFFSGLILFVNFAFGASISGIITDGANPLENVTVDLTVNDTTSLQTSSTGYYSFTGLSNGSTFIVTPTLTHYAFTPTNLTYSNLSSDITDANFTGEFLQFEEINPGELANVREGSICYGDIDNDGDLDLILTGYTGTSRVSKIYQNNGAGSFIEINSGQLSGVYQSSIVLGDIDNDGDLDLILTGDTGSNYISKTYQNSGTGSFTEINSGELTGVERGYVILGDIDNDGNLDLILTGYTGAGHVGKIYRNDGTGSFTEINSGQIQGVRYSTLNLGDIDNDGDLDLILTGYNGSYLGKIYQNNGTGNFTEINAGQLTSIDFGAVSMGDIDNDGDLDLIVSGCPADGNNAATKTYQNDGTGSFTEIVSGQLIDLYYSSVASGDIDNDNDLDLILTGYDTVNYISKIYKNNEETINNIPNTPTNLQADDNNGYWKLSWDAPTDDHTSTNMLRYHIAISTTTSGNYNYINTAIDYPRGQANIGNVCLAKDHYYETNIPLSTKIYWKVNAIDTSFIFSNYSVENTAAIYIVSGVLSGTTGNPISNYSVNITGATTTTLTTSSTGFYKYNAMSNNAYITTPDHTYYNSLPSSYSYNPISSDQLNQNFTITLIHRKISGVIAESGIGLTNVDVSLTGSEVNLLLTSSTGYYEFSSLPSTGTYTITPTKIHYTFSPTSTTYNTLTEDETATDFDATLDQWNISGTIIDGANPINNVTVSISKNSVAAGSTTTNSSGQYS